MSKVIMAVFDNKIVAQAVANSIRQSPDGIININLSSSSQHSYPDNSFTNSVAPLGGDYTQLYTPEFHSCAPYSQMVLRVSCKDEFATDLNNKLSAAGAQKITMR